MTRDIHLKWFFPHPVEAVWECFIDPELMNQWFMKSNFKPEVGYQFQFRDKPKTAFGWDGITYCEVLEMVPNQKLAFSFKGGPRPGKIVLDTVVTWTFHSVNGGTEIILDHTGFSGFKNIFASIMMGKGWPRIISVRFGRVLNEYLRAKI